MKPENLFFDTSGLDKDHAQRLTEEALTGSDDGELFMEHTLSESFSFETIGYVLQILIRPAALDCAR